MTGHADDQDRTHGASKAILYGEVTELVDKLILFPLRRLHVQLLNDN